jgi:hypothetical protein
MTQRTLLVLDFSEVLSLEAVCYGTAASRDGSVS